MYIAHINHDKQSSPHLLKDHVDGMLRITKQFNTSFDLYGMIESSVILHDVGKKSNRFQEYVLNPNSKRGTVQHALGGAFALHHQRYKKLDPITNYFSQLVQLIVANHHTGLDNFDKNFFDKLNNHNLPEELDRIEELAKYEVQEVLERLDGKKGEEFDRKFDENEFNLYISLLTRFTMSALIDADYLDTSAYFNNGNTEKINYFVNFSHFKGILHKYVENIEISNENTSINEIRNEVQILSRNASTKRKSFFTLHAPTGTGKTFAALQFALEHAEKFKKDRIIIALPLINLTEEVSSLCKTIFGQDYVTEDHSGTEAKKEHQQLKYVISERWSTPFVVTTTVQLLESLFHNKPSKLRKLHHIYNSIIIIDEYHQLPLHLLGPIMKVLDMLQSEFNVTVLFMSATPFPLQESETVKQLSLRNTPENIITNKQIFNKLLGRVKYDILKNPLGPQEFIDELTKESSVLVIVNTRKQAQHLFQLLKSSSHSFDKIYHLSTMMCSNHRREVIQSIKTDRKDNNKKIAVISTSVLEAGVDISFPVVFRMLAPLNSIIQSAGRCNRHLELEIGKLVLFKLKDDATSYSKDFEAGIRMVNQLIESEELENLTSENSFIRYYKKVFKQIDLNEKGISDYLMFDRVATQFKMIEDYRRLVLCPTAPNFQKDWLNEKRTREWWEKIKQFTVPIPNHLTDYKDSDGLSIWTGTYDSELGISLLTKGGG